MTIGSLRNDQPSALTGAAYVEELRTMLGIEQVRWDTEEGAFDVTDSDFVLLGDWLPERTCEPEDGEPPYLNCEVVLNGGVRLHCRLDLNDGNWFVDWLATMMEWGRIFVTDEEYYQLGDRELVLDEDQIGKLVEEERRRQAA